MTSSMLAGERRWASARRGGMTVLGKVAVPKPINLPSQKLENHGLDPNVEIVPKGSLSWGSRPSSSTSNPWGSSAISPNAESSTVSPRHPSGRPTSGGGLSRPSTGGSERVNEPSASSWGPNSRPSSASGVLTSNQSSLNSSRPLSAETRPGSSHLSRFAEPVFDNSMAWGPNGTADKLSLPSKANDFSLSSGDFPTLGSEKDNSLKSTEAHDSHVRPGSASGRSLSKERNDISQTDPKTGTVDTWTRDGSPRFVDGVRPNAEKWQQGDPHQYGNNPNVPPQHFDAWRGPPMNAPPPGVWYQGPPPSGPPYPPVPHGGYPMEPFPYYHRPQIPPPLVNSQPGPPPGPGGPRAHHPRNGDFYRPDAFIRPGMPRPGPGFYPGPVPYDGYFGPPPMGYNPNDRDIPFMGMPPGPPHGPPVYNMIPGQNPGQNPNPSELNDPHFRPAGRGPAPAPHMFVSEQSGSVPPEESRGPYKVLRKRENERETDMEDENWEQRGPTNRGADTRRNEDIPSRRNTIIENPSSRRNTHPSDPVVGHSAEGTHKSKASNESWGKKSEIVTPFPDAFQDIPAVSKDPSLMQKIEGLNAKVRASDGSLKEEQKNRLLVNPKDNSTITFGSTSNTVDLSQNTTFRSATGSASSFSRQPHHGVRNRPDHQIKGRTNNQDNDGWRKKPIVGFEVANNQNFGHPSTFQVPDNNISVEPAENPETKNTGESLTPLVDPADGQAQRARMRELAKQRAIQLQKEEEERIREQKAKSLAKLEELNRRTQAAEGTTQAAEKPVNNTVSEQEDVEGTQKPTPPIDASKLEKPPSSDSDAKSQTLPQVCEKIQQQPVVSSVSDAENKDGGGPPRQKRVNQRQKQSVQMVESVKSVVGEAVVSQESTLLNNSSISTESTQPRKRNNKSNKTKHKLDDASSSVPREGDLAKIPESSQFELDSSTVVLTDNKDANQSNLEQNPALISDESHGRANNQYKSQHSRRTPRNPQANRSGDRFHGGDGVMWAPVRAQNKEGPGDEYGQKTVQDDVSKNVNSAQTNLKNKRAEMERYVPKPVAKELAQQSSPSSPRVNSSEDVTEKEEAGSQPVIPVSVNVGPTVESKGLADNKQNKPVKPHGAWRQRGPTEPHRGPTEPHREQGFQHGPSVTSNHPKKTNNKSTVQNEALIPAPTETNVTHEWDPSDGWFMPEELPPTNVTPVVKDDVAVSGKGKKPAYKGQKNTAKNHDFIGAEMEINETDRPASSKENRSSHWQPKPQGYRGGGWSSNASSEVKESHDGGHQESRRERKPASFRGRTHSPNQGFGNMEDEAPFDQQHGFRKYGGQSQGQGQGQNNRSGSQDNRRGPNINRERQRQNQNQNQNQNLHYEYQPVGSNNNNKSGNVDAPADGSSRFNNKERGSGQSRRGGGNFYGRQ